MLGYNDTYISLCPHTRTYVYVCSYRRWLVVYSEGSWQAPLEEWWRPNEATRIFIKVKLRDCSWHLSTAITLVSLIQCKKNLIQNFVWAIIILFFGLGPCVDIINGTVRTAIMHSIWTLMTPFKRYLSDIINFIGSWNSIFSAAERVPALSMHWFNKPTTLIYNYNYRERS